MADPFDVLHAPITPVDPDPTFASRLRSRIERALNLPKGVTVSNLTLEPEVFTTPAATATVVPYLAVAGAEQALAWYERALGAALHGEPYVMPDGRIGHAELEIEGAKLMLSEEHPEIGVVAPIPGEGVPVTIYLSVSDVDALVRRAVGEGATLEREIADYEYGRNGVIRDPFGHRWLVSSEPPVPAPSQVAHGDIGYASLWVPDVERAATFFSSVLQWRYEQGSSPQGRQVRGLSMHHGLWGGHERSNLFLCFAVDDVNYAIARVRESGGTAEDPQEEPYGLISECIDDQGLRFAVYEPPGGVSQAGRGPQHGALPGDVAYVTMEVVDSAKTRAFYGSVLGWTFSPGRVEDGWQVDDVVPMVGISGGHEIATTVPMYRVGEVATAVDRVRPGGGSATEPEEQPYGITSTCTDDQGTRFFLGQL